MWVMYIQNGVVEQERGHNSSYTHVILLVCRLMNIINLNAAGRLLEINAFKDLITILTEVYKPALSCLECIMYYQKQDQTTTSDIFSVTGGHEILNAYHVYTSDLLFHFLFTALVF